MKKTKRTSNTFFIQIHKKRITRPGRVIQASRTGIDCEGNKVRSYVVDFILDEIVVKTKEMMGAFYVLYASPPSP